jgi:meso-butanediol dehydrogenase/(S,S)-butanediol dehydrogenase/diacetyl reductase
VSRFDGQVVLVTGGGSGIGEASARRFAAEGARVIVVDLNEREATRVAGEIGGLAFRADVADAADSAAMVRLALDTWGRLDVLHNNATSGTLGRIADLSLEDWNRVVAVNLTAPFLATKHALPVMLAQGGGAIVNMATAAAVLAEEGLAPYAAAKAGVLALTRNTAAEYGRHGVRANAICPGAVETPPTQAFLAAVPGMRARMEAANPTGRLARPEELAAAVAFLASSDASYLNGATLMVDAGATAVKQVGLIEILG